MSEDARIAGLLGEGEGAPTDIIEPVRRSDGKWGWHRQSHGNNQIIGTDGGQGYENLGDCIKAMWRSMTYARIVLPEEPLVGEEEVPNPETKLHAEPLAPPITDEDGGRRGD